VDAGHHHQEADACRGDEHGGELGIELVHLSFESWPDDLPSNRTLPRVRMRLEIQLSTSPVGYVRVQLRRREIGVAEHLLDAPEIGAAFEQMRGEAVAQQVRVHARWVEAGLLGQPPHDEEGAGARERAAARVEEELRPVPRVQVRAPARDVAPKRLRRLAADRDDPLLVAFSYAADEALVEIDGVPYEADGLADPQPGAVEQLQQRGVAQRPRRRSRRRIDQSLRLARREGAREAAQPSRQVELGGGVVGALAEEDEVAEERSDGGDSACDRRGREALPAQIGDPELELLGRRDRGRVPKGTAQ
jgi:hypothetical protein